MNKQKLNTILTSQLLLKLYSIILILFIILICYWAEVNKYDCMSKCDNKRTKCIVTKHEIKVKIQEEHLKDGSIIEKTNTKIFYRLHTQSHPLLEYETSVYDINRLNNSICYHDGNSYPNTSCHCYGILSYIFYWVLISVFIAVMMLFSCVCSLFHFGHM